MPPKTGLLPTTPVTRGGKLSKKGGQITHLKVSALDHPKLDHFSIETHGFGPRMILRIPHF